MAVYPVRKQAGLCPLMQRYTSRLWPIFTTRMRRASSLMLLITRESPTRYFQNSPHLEPLRASPMLRGSSSMATRSCKKLRMRFADCRSIFLNSLSASLASSICQTIIFHDFLKRHGPRLPLVNLLQPLFGKMQVFEIVQILLDSLNTCIRFRCVQCGQPVFLAAERLHRVGERLLCSCRFSYAIVYKNLLASYLPASSAASSIQSPRLS